MCRKGNDGIYGKEQEGIEWSDEYSFDYACVLALLSKEINKAADHLKAAPLHYALSGGEDYELLFTISPSKLKKFLSLKIIATPIGSIIAGNKMFLISNGKRAVLKAKGFNHFAG